MWESHHKDARKEGENIPVPRESSPNRSRDFAAGRSPANEEVVSRLIENAKRNCPDSRFGPLSDCKQPILSLIWAM